MKQFKKFTGGAYETNSYLLETPEGNILFDAPEGADEHFARDRIDLLVLTHGHWDHTADAAAIKRRHGCPVACHKDTLPMIEEADFFQRMGFPVQTEPLSADRILGEGTKQELAGAIFDVLEVPGHCPGSLCFYSAEDGILVGGDVLFCGGVGRWDLPGGDGELLLRGICEKILPLPGATVVLPGHGPETSVAREHASNPFLQMR